VAVILLNSTASGQSSSSRGKLTLLPNGYAQVKIQDLRYVAAYRVMANDWRTNAVLEISSLRRTIDLQTQQITLMQEQQAVKDASIKAVADRNAQLEQALKECNKKRDRLKPWADAGKVGAAVLVVVSGFTIYKSLTP